MMRSQPYRDDHDIDPDEDAEDYYDNPTPSSSTSTMKNSSSIRAGGGGNSRKKMIAFRDEPEIPEDEYGEDYYDNETGDVVPMVPNGRKYLGFVLVAFGMILVFGGISAAFLGGKGNNAKNDEDSSQANTPSGPAPFFFQEPTPSPVVAPTKEPEDDDEEEEPEDETVETTTAAPSHSPAFSYLASIIGEDILLDDDSLANAAFNWLLDNAHLDRYDNSRIKQRFALAALFLATNFEDEGWEYTDGWMSDDSECDWHGVTCQQNSIIGLNLTTNGLQGMIPFEISLLADSLLAIKLSRNPIVNKDGELAWMGELTKLRLLEVDDTFLEYDGIPTYIKKLTDLRVLDVSNTLFYGELDGSIFKQLHKLMYLELGGNMYNSTLPQEIVKLSNLEALYMYDAGLEGDFDFLADLEGPIYELWMDDNPYLDGTMPTEIGALTSLASLSLSNCELWGQMPSELGALTLMEQMWLFGNWLSGTVPAEIGNLSNLQILAIEDNNITDVEMPTEICDLDLFAVSADCNEEWGFTCDCCTCCVSPCPVANLPIYSRDPTRFLFALD